MMGARGIAVQMARAIAVSLIVAGAVSGTSPARAAAATCAAWTGVQPPDPGGTADQNVLLGVTVLSPCDAWAVGYFLTSGGAFRTLIVHWDGASWQHAPSPTPGVNSSLSAVAATSARNAWAVGAFNNGPGTGNKTLVLHWNGTSWRQVRSPAPGGPGHGSFLAGVRARSASDAWAVGSFFNGTAFRTLALHWNGSAWSQVTTPDPSASDNELEAVAPVSAREAWAVGFDTLRGASQTLILHWNGSSWKQVRSPNPGGPGHDNSLLGARATSASNAWAVGSYVSGTAQRTLVLHWNGSAWQQVKTPNPGSGSSLAGIGATSANNIWAVGSFFNGTAEQTLALHCC